MNRCLPPIIVLALAVSTPLAQERPQEPPPPPPMNIPKDDARIKKLKTEAAADVEAMKDHTQQMVDSIFSFGELGFQETETHRYVVDILKKNGFTVEEGVAGIPTAFMATLGIGQAGDRAGQRHRRHPAGVAEAGRRVPRSADRRRARPRRGAQLAASRSTSPRRSR